ncbi:RES family NAD+ phosphorylase [Xylocopilactobacillus apis]|uniref:RES family NAD+ phosphorylase n=1 Tax=Xylocopilactobacillus apis TaxID=2932183 RepID=UPI00295546AB|nr:RES family NAD+ phosphorylase [Xylocopilactobacillus apis]
MSIYDVNSKENPIADLIIGVIDIYNISTSNYSKPLRKALSEDWDIFKPNEESTLSLVKELCSSDPVSNNKFKENVEIFNLTSKNFLKKHSIIGDKSWRDFSEYIKRENRFHANIFNAEKFGFYISKAQEKIYKNTIMYRARICPQKEGFKKTKMGAPPIDKRISGRVNPEGIGVLYLSLDSETVLNETRASSLDFVSVGSFKSKKDIKIIDLTKFSEISFTFFEDSLEEFAVNSKVLKDIALEIAKPLRRNDSPLEYLPTQYITEFIKSKGYDGVKYASTLRSKGYNVAVFDESLLECFDVRTIEITDVKYDHT